MVMELFPKKKYQDTICERYETASNAEIYAGEAPASTEPSEVSPFAKTEVFIRQYIGSDGCGTVNELTILESDGSEPDRFKQVFEFDLFSSHIRSVMLSSVLISRGHSYAYIYSGSRTARVTFYRYEVRDLRVTRIAFDNRYILLDDLRDVAARVLYTDNCESLLLRSCVDTPVQGTVRLRVPTIGNMCQEINKGT